MIDLIICIIAHRRQATVITMLLQTLVRFYSKLNINLDTVYIEIYSSNSSQSYTYFHQYSIHIRCNQSKPSL